MGARKKTIRRCSNCRKPGHNKATCSFAAKTSVVPYIPVKTQKTSSPHVVDLRDRSEEDIWKGVQAFREKYQKIQQPVTVDFAAMIRDANVARKDSVLVTPKKQKKQAPFFSKKRKNFQIPHLRVPSLTFSFLKKKTVTRTQKEHSPGILESLRGQYARLQWKRLAIASVALFVITAIPFPSIAYYQKVQQATRHIADVSTHGFISLQSSTLAALGADISGAEADLSEALAAFSEAESLLEGEHRILQYVAGLLPVVGGQVDARKDILTAGQHLALGNTYLLKGIEATDQDAIATDKLATLKIHLDRAIPQYRSALDALHGVDPKDVPVEYQQSLIDFRLLFATFIDDMKDMVELIDALELVFGSDDFRRYLVVFQNNREIRATGGFMGSFAIVDVQKGKIVNVDVPPGGTYDIKGQLAVHVAPPLPLQTVNKRWEFQDANWWPDFPASAKKMQWFYEQSRGQTVDGVIALNATVLERFLSIVGPVESSNRGITLTAETGLHTLQEEVELHYDKEENEPKAIIGELVEDFIAMGDSFDSGELMQLLSALHTSAEQKDIQVYMNDTRTQKVFDDFGWSGSLVKTGPQQDYLMVVNTNLQGQKSDAKIKQKIEHQAVVQEDGSIINTVVIRRKHTGTEGEVFYGGPNINYLRVYVPEGAELLEAGGFAYPPEEAFKAPDIWVEGDIDLAQYEQGERYHKETGTRIIESFGKTVFENWVATYPGEESQIYFVYKLPFDAVVDIGTKRMKENAWAGKLIAAEKTEIAKYSLVTQRQSGVVSDFSSAVIYPEGWMPVWKSGDGVQLATNGAHLETTLERDTIIGVIMEHILEP